MAIYGFGVIYGSIDKFDAWNVFVWTFEDFKKIKVAILN